MECSKHMVLPLQPRQTDLLTIETSNIYQKWYPMVDVSVLHTSFHFPIWNTKNSNVLMGCISLYPRFSLNKMTVYKPEIIGIQTRISHVSYLFTPAKKCFVEVDIKHIRSSLHMPYQTPLWKRLNTSYNMTFWAHIHKTVCTLKMHKKQTEYISPKHTTKFIYLYGKCCNSSFS